MALTLSHGKRTYSSSHKHANITTNINSIPMLNGSNFKSREENLLIVLAIIDLDLVLMVNSPSPLMDEITPNDKKEIES